MGLLDQLFAQNGYGLFGQNYPSNLLGEPDAAQAARESAAATLARRFGRRTPQAEQPAPPSIFDVGGTGTMMAGPGVYGLDPNAFAPAQAAAPLMSTIPGSVVPSPMAPQPAASTAP